MLKLIKRYRADPKRTVVVMKNVRSFYLQKRADSLENYAEYDACTKMNDVMHPTETILETGFSNGNECVLEHSVCCDNDAKFAFKSCDNARDLDGCCADEPVLERYNHAKFIWEDQGACKQSDYTKNSLKRAIKPFKQHTKGAFVCEKTCKVLLCDLVAGFAAVLLVIMAIAKLNDGKSKE